MNKVLALAAVFFICALITQSNAADGILLYSLLTVYILFFNNILSTTQCRLFCSIITICSIISF